MRGQKPTVYTDPYKHHQSSLARRPVMYVTVCQRKLGDPALRVVKHDGAGQCTNSGPRCHARQLLAALARHKSPAGGNESPSVRAGCTSWHRHHLTSRSPRRRWCDWNQEKWGMEADGAIPLCYLISLLWASSTQSSSEVKGHTKYISQYHLRGGRKKGGKKWSALVSSQISVGVNWQTVLVFESQELGETAGRAVAQRGSKWGDSFVFTLL